MKLTLLAGAGALGTLARYGLSGWVQRISGSFFPWGTVAVNLLGCFLFALIWAAVENRIQITTEYRLIVFTGFLGAFTTFSTLMFETGQLVKASQYFWALGNIGLQNGLGLVAILIGLILGKLL